MKALIFDLEIVKAIPSKNEPPEPGIEYCGGWGDHEGMGISVLCAYDMFEERYRVFGKSNKNEFEDLAHKTVLENGCLVSFNGIGFDNKVVRACWGLDLPESYPDHYDILQQMWLASGLGPTFNFRTHGGFGLDATAKANFPNRIAKTSSGAHAPVAWQRGEIAGVIDYCLQDVKLTLDLFQIIVKGEAFESPKGGMLDMRPVNL